MLDDHSLADHLARVIADVRLMERVFDIDASGGKVLEVHHGDGVKVALEVASVVTPRQCKELRDDTEALEGIAIRLLRG